MDFSGTELLILAGGAIVVFLILRALLSVAVAVFLTLAVVAIFAGVGVDKIIQKGKDVEKKGVSTTCTDQTRPQLLAQLRAKKAQRAQVERQLKATNRDAQPAVYNRLSTQAASLDGDILRINTCIQIKPVDDQ